MQFSLETAITLIDCVDSLLYNDHTFSRTFRKNLIRLIWRIDENRHLESNQETTANVKSAKYKQVTFFMKSAKYVVGGSDGSSWRERHVNVIAIIIFTSRNFRYQFLLVSFEGSLTMS